MDLCQRYSIHVSKTLDCMGYNTDIIADRISCYKTITEFIENLLPTNKSMIVGSKGEGLSAVYQSDLDLMIIEDNILCSINPEPRDISTYPTVFQMDCSDSPPGYTKLKLVKITENDSLENALVISSKGECYISNALYKCATLYETSQWTMVQNISSVLPLTNMSIEATGPAIKKSFKVNCITAECDIVCCFPIKHSCYIDAWKNRARTYNWPALETVSNAHKVDTGTVVPVGSKGSDNQRLEWRICFTSIEQKLIYSFNDTQSKLYVLLKMIAKEIIKLVCDDVTSYVMKNVALWMAELVPEEQFREHLLLDRLMQALCYLKHCIKINYLASYMIPERNLLARKLTYPQRQVLLGTLNEITSSGGAFLRRCEKLKCFTILMYKVPDNILAYGIKRDMVEQMIMIQFKKCCPLVDDMANNRITTQTHLEECLSNIHDSFFACQTILFNLLLPEWRDMVEQGVDPNILTDIYVQRIHTHLS